MSVLVKKDLAFQIEEIVFHLFFVVEEVESELGLAQVTWILSRNTSRRHSKKLGHSKIPHEILPSWEDL